MKVGPVSVTWLDQPPVGPAHAKIIHNQRLTVQRLQGYVVAPVVLPAVPKPAVRDYAPPAPSDLLRHRPPAAPRVTRSTKTDPFAFCVVLVVLLFVVCAIVPPGHALYQGLFLNTDIQQDTQLTQDLATLENESHQFINTQDHFHDMGTMTPLDTPLVDTTILCVQFPNTGMWVAVPMSEWPQILAVERPGATVLSHSKDNAPC